MGLHSARRSRGASTVAGKGVLTAAAALTLLGGGPGTAFAGEAPSDSGHSTEHQGDDAGKKHEKKSEKCEIPVVDPASAAADEAINEATDDATAPALEAGNEAIAPVHDAVCPPARELLGSVEAPTA